MMTLPNKPNYVVKQTPNPDPSLSTPESTLSHPNNTTMPQIEISNNTGPQQQLDENREKKQFIQNHPLQPFMQEVIQFCQTEGVLPSLDSQLLSAPQIDYSLDEYLEMQGITGR